MARVSVGVPVYNGGRWLEESLACLANQTFSDIEVIISDNASSDETPLICEKFVSSDPRFRYIRQTENLGMIGNFVATREAGSAPLFMWRAADDLSSDNFIEKLVELHDRNSALQLAVCDVKTVADDRKAPRFHPYRVGPSAPRILSVSHRMFGSHASWIYGLWKRETITKLEDRVHAGYDYAWGWDHLTLLPVILDGLVSGTKDTCFEQRIFRAETPREDRKAKRPSVAQMRALRAQFNDLTHQIVEERSWSFLERQFMRALLHRYVDKRGYPRLKLWRRALRERKSVESETELAI